MKKPTRNNSFAPTPEKLDQMKKVPVAHFAEAVDAAYLEFMTAIHECAARAGLDPKVTFWWIITQMADANYHWAAALGKMGHVNFPRSNSHIGATFAETVKKFGKPE